MADVIGITRAYDDKRKEFDECFEYLLTCRGKKWADQGKDYHRFCDAWWARHKRVPMSILKDAFRLVNEEVKHMPWLNEFTTSVHMAQRSANLSAGVREPGCEVCDNSGQLVRYLQPDGTLVDLDVLVMEKTQEEIVKGRYLHCHGNRRGYRCDCARGERFAAHFRTLPEVMP